jgi:hypothetical protein
MYHIEINDAIDKTMESFKDKEQDLDKLRTEHQKLMEVSEKDISKLNKTIEIGKGQKTEMFAEMAANNKKLLKVLIRFLLIFLNWFFYRLCASVVVSFCNSLTRRFPLRSNKSLQKICNGWRSTMPCFKI